MLSTPPMARGMACASRPEAKKEYPAEGAAGLGWGSGFSLGVGLVLDLAVLGRGVVENNAASRVSTPFTPTLVSVPEQFAPLQAVRVICRSPLAVVEMALESESILSAAIVPRSM